MQQEQALREQICLVGEQLHRFRLVDGTAGNISARLDGERVLVTPSGVCKGFMKPEQLIVLDLEGRRKEIFKPLFRGSNLDEIAGNGIGMALVGQLVEQLDGCVHVESGESVGTVVTVRVPITITL